MARKVSVDFINKLVMEEAVKFGKIKTAKQAADDVEEVAPGDEANTLAKQIDIVKALKLEEANLKARLKRVQEKKEKLIKKLVD